MTFSDILPWLAVGLIVLFVGRAILNARRRISGVEAREKVKSGALLLDVRSPGEFRGGGLPGAKNIPITSLSTRLDELPKDRAIVVYCASGMRSASAASLLKRAGYEVHDLGPGSAY